MLVFGGDGLATDFPGAAEVVDSGLEPTLDADELELRRIEAGVPRWGREIDDRDPPRRGRARRDARQLHEGLLSRAGAGGSAALPRSSEPRPARARARRGAGARTRSSSTTASPSAASRARRAARTAPSSRSRTCASRSRRTRASSSPMSRLERADWWTVRHAQNRKPSTYRCPLCGYRLHAMSAARADRARGRHEPPPSRARRMRRGRARRGPAAEPRRVAQDAAATAGPVRASPASPSVDAAATLSPPAPVAQGIERCPAEAEVASSNLAGRMAPYFPPMGRRARRREPLSVAPRPSRRRGDAATGEPVEARTGRLS